jgi:hypothetical protein
MIVSVILFFLRPRVTGTDPSHKNTGWDTRTIVWAYLHMDVWILPGHQPALTAEWWSIDISNELPAERKVPCTSE